MAPGEDPDEPAHGRRPFPFSGRLLKYIDRQKETILIKFDPDVKETLFERIHDLMHDYAKLDPRKNKYPSLSPTYDDGMLRTLTMAAINCDIGKLFIPNRILNKQGPLSEEEWDVIRHHPALAVSKLKEVNVNNPKMFAHIIGHHIINSTVGVPGRKGDHPAGDQDHNRERYLRRHDRSQALREAVQQRSGAAAFEGDA